MPVDLKSMVLKVAENALKQSGSQLAPPPQAKKPVLSTGKAILLGAGLATAGRALASSRGRELVGSVLERMEDDTRGDEDEEYDEPEAEEDDDFDDEPEAEEDDDFDDEPEAEEDDDFDDEPEAEEDDDFEDDEFDDEPEAEEDEDFDSDDEQEDERPRRRSRARSRR